MKQRIISAAIAVAVCIYPLIFGGVSLNILLTLIGLVGLYEYVNCIKKPLNYLLLAFSEVVYLINLYFGGKYFIPSFLALIIALFIVAIYDENITINEVLDKLKDKERDIINKRFFEGRTQMEVAEEIGISQAQISRLEKSAINHIKRLYK